MYTEANSHNNNNLYNFMLELLPNYLYNKSHIFSYRKQLCYVLDGFSL